MQNKKTGQTHIKLLEIIIPDFLHLTFITISNYLCLILLRIV